jgi:hypothetical protein
LGFDRVTGPAESISILKKFKTALFLQKKQKSTSCNLVFDRVLPGQPSCRVTSGNDFFYFYINPARFQSGIDRVPDDPLVGPGFKTIVQGVI